MAEVLVTLRGNAPASAIVRLEQAGLRVDQNLSELGIVTGTSDDDGIARLRALDEVEDVSEAHQVQLPPPEAPVQ